jgi:hypothetical protein
MVMTASTTSAANCFAMDVFSLVESDVLATSINVARSNFEGCLKPSKNLYDRHQTINYRE